MRNSYKCICNQVSCKNSHLFFAYVTLLTDSTFLAFLITGQYREQTKSEVRKREGGTGSERTTSWDWTRVKNWLCSDIAASAYLSSKMNCFSKTLSDLHRVITTIDTEGGMHSPNIHFKLMVFSMKETYTLNLALFKYWKCSYCTSLDLHAW